MKQNSNQILLDIKNIYKLKDIKGFPINGTDINKEIIFQYKLIEEKTNGGCPEVLVTVTHWIYTEKFPDGYIVIFVEI